MPSPRIEFLSSWMLYPASYAHGQVQRLPEGSRVDQSPNRHLLSEEVSRLGGYTRIAAWSTRACYDWVPRGRRGGSLAGKPREKDWARAEELQRPDGGVGH